MLNRFVARNRAVQVSRCSADNASNGRCYISQHRIITLETARQMTMEINGTGLAGLAGQQSSSTSNSLRVKTQPMEHHRPHHHEKHHGGHGKSHGRALNALRVEIRQALSARFQMSFLTAPSAFGDNSGELAPGDVAAETLGAASQIAAQSPLKASDKLAQLREKVDNAANDVRNTLNDDDHDDMDNAVSRVSEGLGELEEDAARNTVSTASVLSAETKIKQRSTIRIRTQEGDIVRFDLRRVESMSVEDVAMSDGDTSFSSTEIEFSSRSRMVLRVKGDLNEAEQAAIQNVFQQAEAIADEFFNGDLAAAFDMASSLEYDVDQLSKVNMRFRERQVSNTSYAAIRVATPAPAPEPVATTDPVSGPASVAPVPIDVPVEQGRSVVNEVTPVSLAAELEEPAANPAAAPEVATSFDDAIGNFMQMLSTFLRSVNEGFEIESGSSRYYHSESFKLEILKSVFQVSAPDESGEAANTAATVIDAVAGTVEESD